ncbi:MAG: hypothetical protein JST01_10815 [Cyanobacteria bacterium SZAS TMP-1]|nr:hypothetical protein [Cyanobacteria bacterium SZAS TMP-1]
MKEHAVLNWLFALSIVLVSGAIAWVAWNCIESTHKNADLAAKTIKNPQDFKASGHSYETVRKDLGAVMKADPRELDDKLPDPRGSEIPFEKGLTETEQGNWSSAQAHFTKALELIPVEARTQHVWHPYGNIADEKFFTAFCYQHRAYCYLQQKAYKQAIADLSEAINRRPGYALNYENRARAYYLLGERKLGAADMALAKSFSER